MADLVVIMPCRNEADNLHIVVAKLKLLKPTAIVIGLDPATNDETAKVAKSLGCLVAPADRSGYDPAAQTATQQALEKYPDSLLLYTDAGDKYSYDQVPEMIAMTEAGYDMVLAVRVDSQGAMLWHQKLGTQVILNLINLRLGQKIRDISPFRLVKSTVFDRVKMDAQKYRWPSELLVKSLAAGLKIGQVDVQSLPRKGTSKVSGSMMNSVRAGAEMFSSLQFFKGSKNA